MVKLTRITLIAMASLLLLSCGMTGGNAAAYRTVTPGTLTPNDPIPAPTGPVVLTLTGTIGATNGSNRLDFDMDALERIGLIEFTVDDPHLKRSVTYQGVLLQRLLDVARVGEQATTLDTIALNDYKTKVPIEATKDWPVMLATKRDGQRMPVADKGPIEIVFPYNSYQFDPTIYDPMWVWQLRSIEVH